jgi:hypothetical protein
VTGQPISLQARRALVCACGLLFVAGCTGPSELFNPEFLQTLGVRESAANLPGEAPAVVVEVENRTGRTIEYLVTWREGNGEIERRTGVLPAGSKDGFVVFCPLEEVTLGDVSDLNATGVIVRLGAGGASDPFIEVEPFGVLLQNEINYNCGDGVTFAVLSSSATLSGYQVYAFIRRSGAGTSSETP